MSESLISLIGALRRERKVSFSAYPQIDPETLRELGLTVDDLYIYWPAESEPLDADLIAQGLGSQDPDRTQKVEVLPAVGSTNDWLRERLENPGEYGDERQWQVVTAECQLAGKGRLGRHWKTPVGGSLALSVGLSVNRAPDALGGLSLVVGLAVLEALDRDGSLGLALKWPNDIQAGPNKVGGILIEMLRTRDARTSLIIGVGLNYLLPAQVQAGIDKEVTDLLRVGLRQSRSEILAAILSHLRGFVDEFERTGFTRFRSAFDAVHLFHERECKLLGAGREVLGRVVGVDAQGLLILETETGLEHFNAGEVSLRER